MDYCPRVGVVVSKIKIIFQLLTHDDEVLGDCEHHLREKSDKAGSSRLSYPDGQQDKNLYRVDNICTVSSVFIKQSCSTTASKLTPRQDKM